MLNRSHILIVCFFDGLKSNECRLTLETILIWCGPDS